MDDVFTVQEVAAALKIHQQTVWKMIRSGQLPAFRLTAAPKSPYRIRGTDVSRMVKARSKQ